MSNTQKWTQEAKSWLHNNTGFTRWTESDCKSEQRTRDVSLLVRWRLNNIFTYAEENSLTFSLSLRLCLSLVHLIWLDLPSCQAPLMPSFQAGYVNFIVECEMRCRSLARSPAAVSPSDLSYGPTYNLSPWQASPPPPPSSPPLLLPPGWYPRWGGETRGSSAPPVSLLLIWGTSRVGAGMSANTPGRQFPAFMLS